MKRGLKDAVAYSMLSYYCSNLCPDEKGTESAEHQICFLLQIIVATYAPMKRGLKGNLTPL